MSRLVLVRCTNDERLGNTRTGAKAGGPGAALPPPGRPPQDADTVHAGFPRGEGRRGWSGRSRGPGPKPATSGPGQPSGLPPGPRCLPRSPRSSSAPSCPSSWQCEPPRPPWLPQVFPAPSPFASGRGRNWS